MNLRQAILLLAAVSLLLGGVGMVQADDHDERPDCADRWTPADPGGIYDVTDDCAHEWQDATEEHEGQAPDETGSGNSK